MQTQTNEDPHARILEYLRTHPGETTANTAKATGLLPKSVGWHLTQARLAGEVRSEPGNEGQRWWWIVGPAPAVAPPVEVRPHNGRQEKSRVLSETPPEPGCPDCGGPALVPTPNGAAPCGCADLLPALAPTIPCSDCEAAEEETARLRAQVGNLGDPEFKSILKANDVAREARERAEKAKTEAEEYRLLLGAEQQAGADLRARTADLEKQAEEREEYFLKEAAIWNQTIADLRARIAELEARPAPAPSAPRWIEGEEDAESWDLIETRPVAIAEAYRGGPSSWEWRLIDGSEHGEAPTRERAQRRVEQAFADTKGEEVSGG